MPATAQHADSADEIIRKAYQSIRRRSHGISPTEVSRSIAIDFEGRGAATGKQAPAPDFLGWRIGDRSTELHGCVLTKKLNFLANPIRDRCAGVRAANLSACVQDLLALAASEQRLLMHFSIHEVEMLQRGLPATLFADTAKHLVDGKPLMERYFKRKRPRQHKKLERFSLEAVAKLLCPGIQRSQPQVAVGKFFGDIRDRTREISKPKFRHLTPGQKDRWMKLLDYNFYDLKMLHRCALKAAKGLTAT